MTYQSVQQMVDALRPVATVGADAVRVAKPDLVPGEVIDNLAATSVFSADPEVKGAARWLIRSLAAAAGIRPASIHDLYMAMGRREVSGFTVPAINIRAMSYNSARAAVRAARKLDAGAVIFEIARSEVGYTEQRPHEYAAVIMASALREGWRGPLFLQGDHCQVNAKKYAGADKNEELQALRGLIDEEIGAGFYNIDIDTSTLVDLSKPTLEEQQRVNFELAADLTRFIRAREPKGVAVSVGGEIGEVGGKNSDVHELRAFMNGYDASRGRDVLGISKISVQTGTAHGGFVRPDGTVRTDVKIDLETLRELSRVAREEFGMGGAVQHGASTLPPEEFGAFPQVGACEIHLATDFQNMIYEHPQFPKDLKEEIYAWLQVHAADERKPKDTEEQFLYKTRKKAIGPFKRRMWDLPAPVQQAIGRSLEDRFAFLMSQLKVQGTIDVVARHVKPPALPIDRKAEIAAAGGTISASEKKAEGLAD
jgi:tagatose 1,6-diphosphate aldolase GatY/KbaY